MNKEFAWVLGMLLSDGSIINPSYRKKGDERHLNWTLHIKDKEVLEKIKTILNTKANIAEYPEYKSPQAKLRIYDRMDIVEKYADIKSKIPEDIIGYERHIMRGMVDGDGCLHYRKNRGSFRINFINEVYEIVEWFSKTLSKFIGIPLKEPKYKPQDHLWIVEWEGKVAKYIAWFLYHGDIEHCVLKRKYDYYKKYVLNKKNSDSYLEELLNSLDLKIKDKKISMNTHWGTTLDWCKMLQFVLKPCIPIPVNKGKKKYYELYLPNS